MQGTDIRRLRESFQLTQEQFAHSLGVTFATVNRWENNRVKPSRLAVRILEQFIREHQADVRVDLPR